MAETDQSAAAPRNLTEIQYAVLVLCGTDGATAYDLERFSTAGHWSILGYSRTQLRATPKALEARGLLESFAEPAERHGERRRYRATSAGLKAARDWLERTPKLPAVDADVVVRLLAWDQVLFPKLLASLLTLEPAIERRRAELTIQATKRTQSLPEAQTALELAYALHLEIMDAYQRWLRRVRKTLKAVETEAARPPRSRAPWDHRS